VIIIITGAFRQVAFVNTNAQIAYLAGFIADSGLVSNMAFIANWDMTTLIRFKWVMTIGFTLFYLMISAWALWTVFKDKKVLIWLVYVYLGIFVLAGVFFFFGKFIENFEIGYIMSRKCMGALQSPFPLMMLAPANYLLHSQEK
jgi:hypothetical protein